MLIWTIRILSFSILMLTLYATATIFKSIWFRFWASQQMDDRQKREFFVKNRYDIKWTSCMMVASLLGFILFQLIELQDLAKWDLFCAFLFGLLLWGNYRTLNTEKEHLKRKKTLVLNE